MYYTSSHEWIKLNGEEATIGISAQLKEQLDEIVYIELPKLDHTVAAGDEIAVLESTKAAIDLTTPLSGTIKEINTSLKEDPNLLSRSPEDEGWVFKLTMSNPSELKNLLTPEDYQKLFTNC